MSKEPIKEPYTGYDEKHEDEVKSPLVFQWRVEHAATFFSHQVTAQIFRNNKSVGMIVLDDEATFEELKRRLED